MKIINEQQHRFTINKNESDLFLECCSDYELNFGIRMLFNIRQIYPDDIETDSYFEIELLSFLYDFKTLTNYIKLNSTNNGKK